MVVRFKFRSSLNFDTVGLEGRPSISLRDLKSKIISYKNLNSCQDFDLELSDLRTGQEYFDDNCQIPDGSSVIIKRVPAGLLQVNANICHSNTCENLRIKDNMKANPSVKVNADILDFDDFGVDLYPAPEATLFGAKLDADKNVGIDGDSLNAGITTSSDSAARGCKKFEAINVGDDSPRNLACDRVEGESFCRKLEPKVKEEIKKPNSVKAPPLQSNDWPSEFKCSLCNSFFKAAVMIPCCQHSFCGKCICQVLLEKATCPKCFSRKSRVEDLLPNLSLRQTIEHFLNSQIITTSLGGDCQRYAPDEESGIQGNDVSCGKSAFQKVPELPHSPSVTGRGSNNVQSPPTYKTKQMNNSKDRDLVVSDDFQGESWHIYEEAESMVKKKKELLVDIAGGDKTFMERGRHKKIAQTCYMCGSPEHLIRDCPAALSARPMPQIGNGLFTMPGCTPFWNGAPLPHVRPFGNIYGNCGMLPFNATMAPTAPFVVPTYMTPMYCPIPSFGCKRMGGVLPAMGSVEDHCASQDLDFQDRKKRIKLSTQNTIREPCLVDDENEDYNKVCGYGNRERSHHRKTHIRREKSVGFSEDGSEQRSLRNYHHYKRIDDDVHLTDEYNQRSSCSMFGSRDRRQNHNPERLSSEVDDKPCSSSGQSEVGHMHHHKRSRKHDKKMEHSSSRKGHIQARNRNDFKRKRGEYHHRKHRQKHCRYSESDSEQITDDEQKLQKNSSQGSRYTQNNSKRNNAEQNHERWQMVSGSDEDGAEEYRYYKRTRGR
ncbi:hypothetical protein UlMin_035735 [Ulmus minor]